MDDGPVRPRIIVRLVKRAVDQARMAEVQAYWLPLRHSTVNLLPQANPEGRRAEGPGLKGPLPNKPVHAREVSPFHGFLGGIFLVNIVRVVALVTQCGCRGGSACGVRGLIYGCHTIHFFHDLQDDGGGEEVLGPARLIVTARQQIFHDVDARLVVHVGESVIAVLNAIAVASLSQVPRGQGKDGDQQNGNVPRPLGHYDLKGICERLSMARVCLVQSMLRVGSWTRTVWVA